MGCDRERFNRNRFPREDSDRAQPRRALCALAAPRALEHGCPGMGLPVHPPAARLLASSPLGGGTLVPAFPGSFCSQGGLRLLAPCSRQSLEAGLSQSPLSTKGSLELPGSFGDKGNGLWGSQLTFPYNPRSAFFSALLPLSLCQPPRPSWGAPSPGCVLEVGFCHFLSCHGLASQLGCWAPCLALGPG